MTTEAPVKPKGFFPKKGWRKVDGVWVAPAPPPNVHKAFPTPVEQRNYLRQKLGWPPLKTKGEPT